MILFIYGPDTYRSKQKLNEIIARYQSIHKSGLSFKVFDAEEESSFEDFKNAIEISSMFGEKKLVVVKGAASRRGKEFSRLFMLWQGREEIRDLRDAICVFYDEIVDRKSEIFKWLSASGSVQEFAMLPGVKLLNWTRKYMQINRISCDQRVPWVLIAEYGGDLWRITNELKKLKVYKRGEKIISEDIDIFKEELREENAFAFADAAVFGNKPRALKLLDAYDSEDSARRTLGLLCWRLRSIAQSGRFHSDKLKKAYTSLADLDLAVKTGKISAKYALEEFIFAQ